MVVKKLLMVIGLVIFLVSINGCSSESNDSDTLKKYYKEYS